MIEVTPKAIAELKKELPADQAYVRLYVAAG
ncbi:MAG: iron-sulfur cluster biosynthesis family protein [Firmicutes bacterium]|nr:iron-sulfur cluster biosynthesis family protein [Bacillota bacterium]